jgi:acetyl esterase/lipase
VAINAATVEKETRLFAVNEGVELKMDLYRSDSASILPQPCLIFVFGGGFKEGERDADLYLPYYNYFAEKGFTVAAIDYRLGMKGEKAPGMLNFKPLLNAIHLAVEDLFSATAYLLEHADELQIDPSLFIISGSSAGAITVLQADYLKQNSQPLANDLPESFRYAGVISFAGGIFSKEGLPTYKKAPAPTLFFHGTADRLVPYNKTGLFHLGMYGSRQLVKRFRKDHYPFTFYSIEDVGHEVAEYPMQEYLPEIEQFISDLILHRKQWMTEIHHKDLLRQSDTSSTPANYYD